MVQTTRFCVGHHSSGAPSGAELSKLWLLDAQPRDASNQPASLISYGSVAGTLEFPCSTIHGQTVHFAIIHMKDDAHRRAVDHEFGV